MNRKQFRIKPETKREKKKRIKEEDFNKMLAAVNINNYNTGIKRREIMIFCETLFSSMKLRHRIMFVIAGQYYYPLKKTYETNLKKKSTDQLKAEKANTKRMKEMAERRIKRKKLHGEMTVIKNEMTNEMIQQKLDAKKNDLTSGKKKTEIVS